VLAASYMVHDMLVDVVAGDSEDSVVKETLVGEVGGDVNVGRAEGDGVETGGGEGVLMLVAGGDDGRVEEEVKVDEEVDV